MINPLGLLLTPFFEALIRSVVCILGKQTRIRMNLLLKTQLTFAIGMLFLMSSCGIQKQIVFGTHIEVKSATEQTFVSGMEDGTSYTQLAVNTIYSELEPISIDSIEFKGKMLPVHTNSFMFSVKTSKGRVLGAEADSTLADNQALIYYHDSDKTIYKCLIESIEKLETMYMP